MTILQVVDRFKDVSGNNGQYEARCPAHDDNRASLCIGTGDDGRVLLKCQAGCETTDVVAAAGLKMSDLFPAQSGQMNGKPKRKIVATYDYKDEDGALQFQVVRFEPKDFRQRRPDGRGGWIWNMKGMRKSLFMLPNIIKNPKAVAV